MAIKRSLGETPCRIRSADVSGESVALEKAAGASSTVRIAVACARPQSKWT